MDGSPPSSVQIKFNWHIDGVVAWPIDWYRKPPPPAKSVCTHTYIYNIRTRRRWLGPKLGAAAAVLGNFFFYQKTFRHTYTVNSTKHDVTAAVAASRCVIIICRELSFELTYVRFVIHERILNAAVTKTRRRVAAFIRIRNICSSVCDTYTRPGWQHKDARILKTRNEKNNKYVLQL